MTYTSEFDLNSLIIFLVILAIVLPFVIFFGLKHKKYQDALRKHLNLKNRKYSYAKIRDEGKKYIAELYDFKVVEGLKKYFGDNPIYMVRVKYIDNDGVEHIVPEDDGYLFNMIEQADLNWLKKQKKFDICVYDKHVSIELPSFNCNTNKFEE